MSPAPTGSATQRPREVFIAGTLTVAASAAILLALVVAMTQLNSAEMRRSLEDFVDANRDRPFTVSIDSARDIFRYMIMAFSVMSGTALVLGIYVLKRHRGARIALTGLGMATAVWPLFIGPVGWLITINIAVAIGLLWTRPARIWFDQLDMPPDVSSHTGIPPVSTDHRSTGQPPQIPPPPGRSGGWPPPSGWGPAPPTPAWPPPSGWRPSPPPAQPTGGQAGESASAGGSPGGSASPSSDRSGDASGDSPDAAR